MSSVTLSPSTPEQLPAAGGPRVIAAHRPRWVRPAGCPAELRAGDGWTWAGPAGKMAGSWADRWDVNGNTITAIRGGHEILSPIPRPRACTCPLRLAPEVAAGRSRGWSSSGWGPPGPWPGRAFSPSASPSPRSPPAIGRSGLSPSGSARTTRATGRTLDAAPRPRRLPTRRGVRAEDQLQLVRDGTRARAVRLRVLGQGHPDGRQRVRAAAHPVRLLHPGLGVLQARERCRLDHATEGPRRLRAVRRGPGRSLQAPVHSWEIWNEPDIPEFWTGSTKQYAAAARRGLAHRAPVRPDGPGRARRDRPPPGVPPRATAGPGGLTADRRGQLPRLFRDLARRHDRGAADLSRPHRRRDRRPRRRPGALDGRGRLQQLPARGLRADLRPLPGPPRLRTHPGVPGRGPAAVPGPDPVNGSGVAGDLVPDQ